MKRPSIRQVPAGWEEVVLVCRKCSKRLGGGFGPDGGQRLAKALRRELGQTAKGGKPRKQRVGVVEVGCFDICPKDAAIAVRASAPGEWLVIPRRTALDEVCQRLRL